MVGLEGDDALLNKLAIALQSPVFPLFLGRRSCPPEGEIFLKIVYDKKLYDVLESEESIISRRKNEPDVNKRRIVVDADLNDKDAFFIRDIPLSFDQAHRKYGFRCVYERSEKPEHDAMQELDELGGD